MPRAIELISGRATAPGATLTSVTMAAGNSATVRNTPLNARVYLLQTWAENNAAGIMRIRSPRLHDAVQGIRFRIDATDPAPLMPFGNVQVLIPQDTLTLELSGSAVGGQIEQMQLLVYYEDLTGVAARLITSEEANRRGRNVEVQEVAIVPGVAGGYSGQVAINSTFDNLKANTDYAILGYLVDTRCAAVRFQGPDFGGLGLGGPGLLSPHHLTAQWFMRLSEEARIGQTPPAGPGGGALPIPGVTAPGATGPGAAPATPAAPTGNLPIFPPISATPPLPPGGTALIPVFNAANKLGTFVDVVQDQGGASVNVSVYCLELAP